MSYAVIQNDRALAERYATPLESSLLEKILEPLPLTLTDSLTSYNILQDTTDLERFLEPVLESFVTSVTAAPPEHDPSSSSRPSACEICEREHLPLTYHHLIPRSVHAKVVKRGWHAEWELGKVAWLCRACHSFVHGLGTNEELARDWYSVELLMEREDVQRWAKWVGRVRWKAR